MEFLLEQINRDERMAALDGGQQWTAERVAAECDAKRRILAYAEILIGEEDTRQEGLELLDILASPYRTPQAN